MELSLNWLGSKSYGVYNELEFSAGKSKTNVQYVLEAFEAYFKPTQSLFQSWYQFGRQYSNSFKSQMDFMLKLKEIVNDCSFTNSDEVVKFLFLAHNLKSRVKDALLDKMKGTSTLMECLMIAKTVESTIETEKLSKSFLQTVNKPETAEVDEIHGLKGRITTKVVAEDRESTEVPVAKVVKDRASVGIVVTITHLENALPMEKNASDARSPTNSRSSAEVTHRTGSQSEEVVVGKHIKTCIKLTRKMIHLQCMNMMLLMSELCISLPMSSSLIMQTLHLIRFPVIGNYSVSLQMSLSVIR